MKIEKVGHGPTKNKIKLNRKLIKKLLRVDAQYQFHFIGPIKVRWPM